MHIDQTIAIVKIYSMQMFTRIRYLFEEGFRIVSVETSDGFGEYGDAAVFYYHVGQDGQQRSYSEHFFVKRDEMEACSRLLKKTRQWGI